MKVKNLERKTGMQILIENKVTKDRGYMKIPKRKFLLTGDGAD